ncbi:MAG: glycerol-3-phosphate 1-O-acyltransferase PlsY [Aestuariivita sp.]|nr:glycerol-3-phosphate 1-O-acyltransferase PlsY [Aestuariivita sp.]
MPTFETDLHIILVLCGIAYILGSIPFGILLSKILQLGDLRKIGSGNIGATNVLRTGNKTAAAVTLLLDTGKGTIVVYISQVFASDDAIQLAALFALVGHCFPIWMGFRGGKGVATFFGIWLAYVWFIGLICCCLWIFTAIIFRISSLAALVATVGSFVAVISLGFNDKIILSITLATLIALRHRENIKRIISGTELKINLKNNKNVL